MLVELVYKQSVMFWRTFNSKTIPRQSVSVENRKQEATIAIVINKWCDRVAGGLPAQKAFSKTCKRSRAC